MSRAPHGSLLDANAILYSNRDATKLEFALRSQAQHQYCHRALTAFRNVHICAHTWSGAVVKVLSAPYQTINDHDLWAITDLWLWSPDACPNGVNTGGSTPSVISRCDPDFVYFYVYTRTSHAMSLPDNDDVWSSNYDSDEVNHTQVASSNDNFRSGLTWSWRSCSSWWFYTGPRTPGGSGRSCNRGTCSVCTRYGSDCSSLWRKRNGYRGLSDTASPS